MKKIFGPIVGRAFVVYWTAYAGLLNVIAQALGIGHPWYGAHRTWLSHSIIPGTLIRMIFFSGPVALIWWMFFDLNMTWLPYIYMVILGQFIAFGTGDYIHIALDNDKRFKNQEPAIRPREYRSQRTYRSRRNR